MKTAGSRAVRVRNVTKGTLLGDAVQVAETSAARRAGLLGRSHLEPGGGLWIVPSEGVHTFGMQFAIDVVFLSKARTVLKIRAALPKRRIAFAFRAHSVLELPAGALARSATATGDQLSFETCG